MTPSALLTLCRPGTFENGFAELFAALINTKDRGEILQLDIGAAIIRILGEPE